MGDIAHGGLDALAEPAKATGGKAHQQGDDRRHREEDEGQLPVEIQQEPQIADDDEALAHQHPHRVRAGAGDLLHMVGDLRHQMPHGLAVVESAGQEQQAVEQLGAQVMHQAG